MLFMFSKCQTASTDLWVSKSKEAAIIGASYKLWIANIKKKKINSNKTAHYYQVRFKYLAEKSKLIFGSFNSTPLKTAVVMMPDYFVVDNELW